MIAVLAIACVPPSPPPGPSIPGEPALPPGLTSVTGVGDVDVVHAAGDRCVLAIGLLKQPNDPLDPYLDRTVLGVTDDAGLTWRVTPEVYGATVAFVARPTGRAWLLTSRASGQGPNPSLYAWDQGLVQPQLNDAIDAFLHANQWHYDTGISDLRAGPDGVVAAALSNDHGWAVSTDEGATWTSATNAPAAAIGPSDPSGGPCRVTGASPWLVQHRVGSDWVDAATLR